LLIVIFWSKSTKLYSGAKGGREQELVVNIRRFSMQEADRPADGLVPAEGWDPGLQGQLAEINAQLLESLRRRAHVAAGAAHAPLIAELAPLWKRLGEPALHALARCPYLLFDAGFGRPEYWAGAVHEASELRDGGLTQVIEPDLVRRTVMLGWHLARANPFAARMSLGMTPQCARLIAAMRLRELEMLVERRAIQCRLRWEDRPMVWRQLLEVAATGSLAQLEALRFRGVQLMAADLRRT
jgi:hypothetical protein